jgi:hypothetical protein
MTMPTDRQPAASEKSLSLDLDLTGQFTGRRDDDSGQRRCGASIEKTLGQGDEEGYGLVNS